MNTIIVGNTLFYFSFQLGKTGRLYKKEQCAICGKTLCSKYALKKHEDAVHFNIRPFGCDICPKRFIMKNDLRDHITAVHKKIKVTFVLPRFQTKTFVIGFVHL